MTPTLQRMADCGSLTVTAAKIAMRLFTKLLAAMGLLLWLSDSPITWSAAWPLGIAIWTIGMLVQIMFFGRL